jgi:hypothetical protein
VEQISRHHSGNAHCADSESPHSNDAGAIFGEGVLLLRGCSCNSSSCLPSNAGHSSAQRLRRSPYRVGLLLRRRVGTLMDETLLVGIHRKLRRGSQFQFLHNRGLVIFDRLDRYPQDRGHLFRRHPTRDQFQYCMLTR